MQNEDDSVVSLRSITQLHALLLSFLHQPVNEESSDIIVAKPFTLGEGMKRVKELKRASLRGPKNMDSVATMTEAKDIIKSHLDSMQTIQKHLQDGDQEGAGFAFKSLAGDAASLVATRKDLKGINVNEVDFSTSLDTTHFLNLDDIPGDKLVQFIPIEVISELVENTKTVHDLLGGIDPSIFSATQSHEGSKNKHFYQDRFFGGESSFRFPQSSANANHHASNFFKSPSSIKKLLRHQRSRMAGSISMPKLSKFTNFHNDDIIMAKHQLRVDALGDTCAPTCEIEDDSCMCERLFECVNEMTEYGKLFWG